MNKPIIGITLDHEKGSAEGGYSPFPWYAIRENYCSAIKHHNGVPVLLPHDLELVEIYMDIIDGLLLTGGEFDVSPSLYGDNTQHEKVSLKEQRTAFEYKITKMAVKCDMPILGICGGEQLLNVVLGGTLIQHIPDEINQAVEHENPEREHPAHEVTITEKTLLHSIIKETTIGVNTSHHQAVKDIAPNMVINAVAPDGVIEGIEYPEHPFCLGVQWHPEYRVSAADDAIIAAFVNASVK